jgi:transcriptional regulator with XRE-family HTH domain
MELSDREHVSLGEYLRAARERAGYSIRELAKKVSLHHSYVARLENGEAEHPSPELLRRLASALDIEVAELWPYIGVESELPEPRAYFRRKLGVDADEAEVLARLIEDYQTNKTKGGTP